MSTTKQVQHTPGPRSTRPPVGISEVEACKWQAGHARKWSATYAARGNSGKAAAREKTAVWWEKHGAAIAKATGAA